MDEAHQITNDASSALLKTLEEPPPHLVVILCTTHPWDILPTIRSRVQHYVLRKPGIPALVRVLDRVARAEGIETSESALDLLARAADGSYRDALGLLDQIATYGDKRVGVADALELLGAVARESIFELVDLIAGGEAAGAFELLEDTLDGPVDPEQAMLGLVTHLRYVCLLQQGARARDEWAFSPEEIARLQAQANQLSDAQVVRGARPALRRPRAHPPRRRRPAAAAGAGGRPPQPPGARPEHRGPRRPPGGPRGRPPGRRAPPAPRPPPPPAPPPAAGRRRAPEPPPPPIDAAPPVAEVPEYIPPPKPVFAPPPVAEAPPEPEPVARRRSPTTPSPRCPRRPRARWPPPTSSTSSGSGPRCSRSSSARRRPRAGFLDGSRPTRGRRGLARGDRHQPGARRHARPPRAPRAGERTRWRRSRAPAGGRLPGRGGPARGSRRRPARRRRATTRRSCEEFKTMFRAVEEGGEGAARRQGGRRWRRE